MIWGAIPFWTKWWLRGLRKSKSFTKRRLWGSWRTCSTTTLRRGWTRNSCQSG
jgi:hypothetical protein